ncbi:MAG TPA: hypothetical protein VJS64_08540, partial [Pyrinomonadaceae bacterium]|nr:hypothetical protein [Pyrinomonadaceae bacterium]
MTKEANQQTNGLLRAAADLFPGYFALVMATGIVSIAAHLLDMKTVATSLLAINVIAYMVLLFLLIVRLIFFFSHVRADISDHLRGPGFFTVVAGTCVLGSQLVIVSGQYKVAAVL